MAWGGQGGHGGGPGADNEGIVGDGVDDRPSGAGVGCNYWGCSRRRRGEGFYGLGFGVDGHHGGVEHVVEFSQAVLVIVLFSDFLLGRGDLRRRGGIVIKEMYMFFTYPTLRIQI